MYIDTEHLKLKNGRTRIESEENVLWLKIKNGDEEALADLFRLYYNRLFNYGIKIVKNDEFIKDCIQELFLTIWDRKKYINEAFSVSSYLISSLRRTIFRKIRKQKTHYERNKKYFDHHFQETLNIEELIIHFETRSKNKEQLACALDQLGGRQKEAIYLKFYDGLSNNEIADVMGINKQSVYNHVSGAIRMLQKFIT